MNCNHGTKGVRVDRWLWAARFFKTRSLANNAVQGGHVHINGQRAKPSRQIHTGNTIGLHREPEHYEFVIGCDDSTALGGCPRIERPTAKSPFWS